MDEQLLQDLARVLLEGKSTDTTFEYVIKPKEERIAIEEAEAAEYRARGDRENEKIHQINAAFARNEAMESYEYLVSSFSRSLQIDEKENTGDPQVNRNKAAQTRSMIQRLNTRIAHLKAQGTVTQEEFKAQLQKIVDIRKEREAKQAAEQRSRQEREVARQRAQEQREQDEAMRQKKEPKSPARSINPPLPSPLFSLPLNELYQPYTTFMSPELSLPLNFQASASPVVLGTDCQTGEQVMLSAAARRSSLYVIGTTGVGKSTLLEMIALQDLENGDGFCFLDPHGDSVRNLLARVPIHRRQDVLFWDPKDLRHPVHLNPFYCPMPDDFVMVDRKVEDFISALAGLREFAEVFKNAPQMLDILRHMAFACVLKQGTTLLDSARFLTNVAYRRTFYPYLRRFDRIDILEYWELFDEKTPHRREELISSSLNKLHRLATTSITRAIFQSPKPSLDLRTLMDEGKILLVDLSRLGEGNGELIGAFIVFELLQAAFSRGDMLEVQRRPFHVFADEFERFMTTAFPQILDEGRKFKFFSVLAHQHRGQLEGASHGSTLNIKNKVVFRVNSLDAAELAPGFNTKPPPQEITGYQPLRTLSPTPWTSLFSLSNTHTNPKINDLVERLALLFWYRYGDSSGLDKAKAIALLREKSPDAVSEQYPYIRPPYPFRLFDTDLAACREAIGDENVVLEGSLDWKTMWELGNRYLLSCQQGKRDEAILTKMAQGFVKIAPPDSVFKITNQRTVRTAYGNSTFTATDIVEFYRDPIKYHKLSTAHILAKKVVYHLFTLLLQALGDLLIKEENHIKTESGQYEPTYGPLRQQHDVAAEIANTLTLLPKFTAHCIPEEQGELIEYNVRTLPPPPLPTGAQAQTQVLIEQSIAFFDAANRASISSDGFDLMDNAHDIIPSRNPAYADASHPLLGDGIDAAVPPQRDDEGDPWR